MHNSLTVFIFSVTVALIAISFSSSLLLHNKSINKSLDIIERSAVDIDFIEKLKVELDNVEDLSFEVIKNKIMNHEDEKLSLEVKDISSKMNINFIDLTLFKKYKFRVLLKNEYSWNHLQEYRNEIGFTTDIYQYEKFFKEDIDISSILTVYNLPNINNSSDIMLEKYYESYTGSSSKASSFKTRIDGKRNAKKVFDEKAFLNLMQSYDSEIVNIISVLPSWNINNVDSKLLNAILSKYNINSTAIMDLRDIREIKESELISLLSTKQENKTLYTFLGCTTSFISIKISDNLNSNYFTLIFKLNAIDNSYSIISINKGLL